MTKENLETLKTQGWDTIRAVSDAIRTLTAENPLILFDKDNVDSCGDELYDLPYGYYVGKYDSYNEGTIWKVQGNDVTLFLRCEGMFGEEWEQTLEEVPFESLVSLLDYLIERAEA
jgi:hypothetical protein